MIEIDKRGIGLLITIFGVIILFFGLLLALFDTWIHYVGPSAIPVIEHHGYYSLGIGLVLVGIAFTILGSIIWLKTKRKR